MTAPGSQSPKRGRPPLGKTPDQPRPRTCHLDSEQGSQWSPTFCTKLLQFSFPPLSLQRPGKRRRRLGRREPGCSATSPDRAVAATAQEGRRGGTSSTSHWFQGTTWGGRKDTRAALIPLPRPSAVGTSCPVPIPGVAPPFPGSVSAPPSPRRPGGGDGWGGPGWNVWSWWESGGQVPLCAPTGGL